MASRSHSGAPRSGFAPNPPSGQLPTPPPIPTTWTNAYLPSETKNFSETLDHNYYGIYAQDQWRLRHNLTMNYGLRYDVESGLTKQINPHYNGVQPRLGLAWSPDSKTVVRTGFGIFDDRYNLSFLFITQPQRPVIIPGETLPGIRDGANTAGWVLNQFTPGPLGLPFHGGRHVGYNRSSPRPIHHRPVPAVVHRRSRHGPAWQPNPLLRAGQS